MRRKTAKFIILMGIAIAAVPFLLRMQGEQKAGQYIIQLEENENEESEKTGSRKKKDSPYLAEDAIGIVEILELKIKYPVFEGTGAEQLNEGIGHMEGTAHLCGKGNCVLAGHNGSRRGIFFTNLCSIRVGAEVQVTTRAGVAHSYTVEEMRVVNPYEEWVTEKSDAEVLTLFTCVSHGTKRFACKCVPVKDYGRERGMRTMNDAVYKQ